MPPSTRSETRSARDLVQSHLTETQATPDNHSAPEVDTAVLTGLYDYPPDDVRSREHVVGRRQSVSTERNKEYRKGFQQGKAKRLLSNETRATNKAGRKRGKKAKGHCRNSSSGRSARLSEPEASHQGQQRGRSRTVRAISQSPPPGSTDDEPDEPQPSTLQPAAASSSRRKRISRSPSPGSTDHESNQASQARTPSQFTYVYETLDHEGLIRFAQEEFGVDGQGCDTQAIIEKLQLAQEQQKAEVGSSRRPPSIVIHSPKPIQVGGGWSQDVIRRLPTSSGKKRTHDASDSGGSSKRQRTVATEDTATVLETDDEFSNHNNRRSFTGPAHNVPAPLLPPAPCESTAPTVIEIQSSRAVSRSHSLGGSLPYCNATVSPSRSHNDNPTSPAPSHDETELEALLPSCTVPIRGRVHLHLRESLIGRYADALHRRVEEAEAAEADQTTGPNEDRPLEEVPGVDNSFDNHRHATPPSANRRANPQRTYGGTQRSYLRSQPGNTSVQPITTRPTNHHADSDEDIVELGQPNSPGLTVSQLIRRERARAVAAKARAEMVAQLPSQRKQHPRIFTTAKAPPTSRPQARPPPGGRGNAIGRRAGGTRRLDPISAARADMLAFNKAVARGEATSLVESVTRQSQRTARRAAPVSRPADGLLEDDEESLAQAEAYANSTWPATRIYKQKPLARDVSGLDRQVLIMAKVHLFAYALVEGVYQTRATYIRWASAVHIATWQMELPDRPYNMPPQDIFEIMVNNIATLRGKIKERLREFVANVIGFEQTLTNHQTMLNNLAKFDEVYPNTFHCKSYTPRYGDYEHPEIGRCIALAFFNGPGSVGLMYPDYFRDMPITVVAFALAMWQYCIEEWANGWRENGDLGMAAMREKYESQLSKLKELREVAPRRMNRLQTEWRDYVAAYSGAVFISDEEFNADPPRPSNIRPDTPEPGQGVISVDEMNDRLLETGRQASLRDRMQAIAARETEEPMDLDESRLRLPPSRPFTPLPVEFNEQGILTARSKGKGRAD